MLLKIWALLFGFIHICVPIVHVSLLSFTKYSIPPHTFYACLALHVVTYPHNQQCSFYFLLFRVFCSQHAHGREKKMHLSLPLSLLARLHHVDCTSWAQFFVFTSGLHSMKRALSSQMRCFSLEHPFNQLKNGKPNIWANCEQKKNWKTNNSNAIWNGSNYVECRRW